MLFSVQLSNPLFGRFSTLVFQVYIDKVQVSRDLMLMQSDIDLVKKIASRMGLVGLDWPAPPLAALWALPAQALSYLCPFSV